MKRSPFRRKPPDRAKQRERRAKREARKMLAELRRTEQREQEGGGALLTDWERSFQSEVPQRLQEQGRAFHDPQKAAEGDPDAPLSLKQMWKARQIRSLVRTRLRRRDGR